MRQHLAELLAQVKNLDLQRVAEPSPFANIPVLRHLRFVQIDYPGRTVRLSSTLPYEHSEALLLGSTRLIPNARAAVTQGTIDGINHRILIDSAGDFSLILPGGEAKTAKEVILGDLVVSNLKTSTPEEHGLQDIPFARIGRKVLTKFKITFDFRRNLLIFERPPLGK